MAWSDLYELGLTAEEIDDMRERMKEHPSEVDYESRPSPEARFSIEGSFLPYDPASVETEIKRAWDAWRSIITGGGELPTGPGIHALSEIETRLEGLARDAHQKWIALRDADPEPFVRFRNRSFRNKSQWSEI